MARANFGVVGLGVMGGNLAQNFRDHGAHVAVWNYERDKQERFVAEHPGFHDARTLAELVQSLERPRRVLVMVTDTAVDSVIEQLTPLLETGDVIIDGGNSHYQATRRREAALRGKGLRFVGMGVSGGEEGARHGPSLMPGGDREAYEALKPLLEAIAARTESGPCVTHCGPDGAGHFVKMVHNGIEYADMQLIAEAYDLCRRDVGLDAPALAGVFERWNRGPLQSFLIEITAKIFKVRDPRSGGPLVDRVLDKAGSKGTGRWTVEAALELGVPVPAIAAALDARMISARKDERVRMSKHFPDQPSRHITVSIEERIAEIHDALYVAKIGAYAQGMMLLSVASEHFGWRLPMAELARIWKGGCIIRANLLDPIMQAYGRDPKLSHLLMDDLLGAEVRTREPALRSVARRAALVGIPVPAMTATLSWFDAMRSAELPQNLTQAQRDAFGAHTFVRADDVGAGPQHFAWLE